MIENEVKKEWTESLPQLCQSVDVFPFTTSTWNGSKLTFFLPDQVKKWSISNCRLLWSRTYFLLPLMGKPAQSNISHSNLFRSTYLRDQVASITVLKNYFNSGKVIFFCFKKLEVESWKHFWNWWHTTWENRGKGLWYSLLLKRWRIQISQIVCSKNTIPTVVFSGRFLAMEETDSCDQPKAKSKIPTQGHWTGHPLTFFQFPFCK